MMKKTDLEMKVGLFVFVALALLAWLVFKSGDFYLKPGYNLRFVFDSVSGITPGAPVNLAGMRVGEVSAITAVRSPQGVTQIEVSARIDQGAFIEENAEVRVGSMGLLGEKYIDVQPGAAGAKVLAEGSTLIGKPPLIFEKLTETGSRLLSKIEYTVDNINQVVGDPEFKDAVKGTFVNAESTFADAQAVMKDLREASDDLKDAAKSARIVLGRLREGQGTIGRLLMDDKIAQDLEAFVADIKKHPWKLMKRN